MTDPDVNPSQPESEPTTNGHPLLTDALGVVIGATGVALYVFLERFPVWALVACVGLGAYLVDPRLVMRLLTVIKDKLPGGSS